jgi:hypothetical protein
MKNSVKKTAYNHDSIRDLYDGDDWFDEDELRNKRKQKDKSKNRRRVSKEEHLNE